MRRLAVTLVGIVVGLLVTWLCLYSFSRVDWPGSGTRVHACFDLEHCAVYWWTYPLLLAELLAPSLMAGLVNAVAWKRWTRRRWSWTFGLLILATILFYLSLYLVPSPMAPQDV